MAQQRHLEHAPIREGLIDIHFEPPVGMERLQAFADLVKDRFAECTTIWQQAFGFTLQDGIVSNLPQPDASTPIGLRLSESTHVLLLRINGFTFSRLPPYQDWDELRANTLHLWERFVEVAQPETVTRTAVRYINVLPLPLMNEDFDKYLEAPPVIPGKLPQVLASFLQRAVIVDAEQSRQAIVTQALEESQPVDGKVHVFLDIDVFRATRFGAKEPAVWDSLDNLREFKNQIFFDHITEKTAGLFE